MPAAVQWAPARPWIGLRGGPLSCQLKLSVKMTASQTDCRRLEKLPPSCRCEAVEQQAARDSSSTRRRTLRAWPVTCIPSVVPDVDSGQHVALFNVVTKAARRYTPSARVRKPTHSRIATVTDETQHPSSHSPSDLLAWTSPSQTKTLSSRDTSCTVPLMELVSDCLHISRYTTTYN